MRLKMTKENKCVAYILSRNFHYTMDYIARGLGVSQGTISNSIKEVEWLIRMGELNCELESIKEMLRQKGYSRQVPEIPTINLSGKIPVVNPIEKIQQ